jgi:hypothetical protein
MSAEASKQIPGFGPTFNGTKAGKPLSVGQKESLRKATQARQEKRVTK